jgi:serine/threonine protein kinase
MDINVGGPPTKPLSVETARSYFRQLTLGLEYLHSAGVTHRDIKVSLRVIYSTDSSSRLTSSCPIVAGQRPAKCRSETSETVRFRGVRDVYGW